MWQKIPTDRYFPVSVNPQMAFWLQVWTFSIVLLSLISPVVISDDSLCSSSFWCVKHGSIDPCSLDSLHTRARVQSCHCIDYQLNISVCLNNVSAVYHFVFLISVIYCVYIFGEFCVFFSDNKYHSHWSTFTLINQLDEINLMLIRAAIRFPFWIAILSYFNMLM